MADDDAAGAPVVVLDGEAGGQAVTLVRNGGTLTPFRKGDGRAAEAGRRGAATRRARALAERAASDAVASELRTLAGSYRREDLGPAAVAAALDMIGRVVRGEQSVRDPADWVRVLVDVARLEAGEPTSASVVAHVGGAALARARELRDEARAALDAVPSSSAQAADDAGSASPVVEVDG
jgi:hypothetical protein